MRCAVRGGSLLRSGSSPLAKYLFGHRQRRHGVRPASIECEMGDDLGCLLLGETVVHGAIQMERDLRDLA
jgi:hypothetical protein